MDVNEIGISRGASVLNNPRTQRNAKSRDRKRAGFAPARLRSRLYSAAWAARTTRGKQLKFFPDFRHDANYFRYY
ncbi:MAG TPA: hypothetical protein VE999_08675 [Gemmataceae bacterium]|nr:hypothetical protein [Gemmataceae bacterium]